MHVFSRPVCATVWAIEEKEKAELKPPLDQRENHETDKVTYTEPWHHRKELLQNVATSGPKMLGVTFIGSP